MSKSEFNQSYQHQQRSCILEWEERSEPAKKPRCEGGKQKEEQVSKSLTCCDLLTVMSRLSHSESLNIPFHSGLVLGELGGVRLALERRWMRMNTRLSTRWREEADELNQRRLAGLTKESFEQI